MLKTKRLTLKKIENKDCLFILELLNTRGWIDFIGNRNVNNKEDALKYIKKINENPTITYWVVSLKNTTQIGIITLIKREHLEHYDIGFAFLPLYHNKGYAYEASQHVLHHIMKSTNFRIILATTKPQNTNSIKLIKKLGMTFYKSDIQNNKDKLSLFKIDLDKIKINQLVKAFFSAFTNKSVKPNFKILNKVCIDEVIIIKNTNSVCEKYNLESFISPRKDILTNGTITDFEETEVNEKTIINKNIALRVSQYEKKGIRNNNLFFGKGTKMFQFIKIENNWKICSLIWDDK